MNENMIIESFALSTTNILILIIIIIALLSPIIQFITILKISKNTRKTREEIEILYGEVKTIKNIMINYLNSKNQ